MDGKPIRMNGRGILATWALALCSLVAVGQGSIEIDGTVRDKDTNRKLAGVQVEVLQAGQQYDAVETLGNGKYTLSLDHGSDYVLVFTMGDLSERRVEVNTSTIPEEFRERPFYLTVEMSLFEVPEGFDEGLLREPIGKVAFNAAQEKLDWDLDYTRRMQDRIKDALEDASPASGGGEAAASASTNRAYEEHMRKAEVEFGRGRWEQSLNWLERALEEVPGDARAESMMEEAAENLSRAEEEAERNAEYERLLREGKIQLKRKAYEDARAALQAASDLKPEESEPVELLAEIDAATGGADEDVAEEVVKEPEPDRGNDRADRAAELQREREMEAKRKEYERLIARADKSFDRQNYAEARDQYLEASAVLPDEVYPRTRAMEAEERIVDLTQSEEEVTESAPPSGPSAEDRDYEDRVREGDEAFDAEEWTTAKAAYEAALQIRPEERYPKNRLRRLEALMEDVPVDVELDVDTESLLEADAQQAEQERLAADRMAQEQADLLEAERLAAEEEEGRKRDQARAASDASRDRSQNYILALQNQKEDDAEAYYRNALEAEIWARAQSVEVVADRNEELHDLWTGNSHARRGAEWQDIQGQSSSRSAWVRASSRIREDRVAELDIRTEAQREQNLDVQARASALRRDRYIEVEDKTEWNRERLFDRTKRYATFVDSLDRMLRTYADFNRDLRRTSVDARMMNYDAIQRQARTHQQVGVGEEARRIDNWVDIKAAERNDSQSKRIQSGEAKLRAAGALREAQGKYSGAPLTSEDYKEVQAKEGIRKGVEERSYEEGNALIIERTVRVDNEVNVYRKTVAKHGVYYFKNNHSITRDIWILETFQISD